MNNVERTMAALKATKKENEKIKPEDLTPKLMTPLTLANMQAILTDIAITLSVIADKLEN